MMDRVMCAVLGRILLVEAAVLLPPGAVCRGGLRWSR